jgi:Na+-driven multidrug efflux pump
MVVTCLLPINIASNYILVFGVPPILTGGLGFVGS